MAEEAADGRLLDERDQAQAAATARTRQDIERPPHRIGPAVTARPVPCGVSVGALAVGASGVPALADARIGFWDALIIAVAVRSGARRVRSEDLNPGHPIADITICNPFAA